MENLTNCPNWDGKKILLVRLDRIGDLIVTTPSIHAIHKTFPKSKIHMLASKLNAPVLKYCDCIDKVHVYDKKNIINTLKLFLKLRSEKYDIIICFTPHSRSSSFFAKYISAPIKLAFVKPPARFEKTYTHCAPQATKEHMLEMFQENAIAMGFELPILTPILNVPQTIYQEINNAYPKNPEKMRIIISLGNIKRPYKMWNIESFVKVVEYLSEKYNRVDQKIEIIVMTGISDKMLLDHFKEIPSEYYTAYIGKDIAESAAFIENSDLFICTSSGPSHIASSTSCPILSLLTPYMYKVWRPLREHDVHIVSEVLQDISIDEVSKAIDNYIEKYFKKI